MPERLFNKYQAMNELGKEFHLAAYYFAKQIANEHPELDLRDLENVLEAGIHGAISETVMSRAIQTRKTEREHSKIEWGTK